MSDILADYVKFLEMCEKLVEHYVHRTIHPLEFSDKDGTIKKIPPPKLGKEFYAMIDGVRSKIKEIS